MDAMDEDWDCLIHYAVAEDLAPDTGAVRSRGCCFGVTAGTTVGEAVKEVKRQVVGCGKVLRLMQKPSPAWVAISAKLLKSKLEKGNEIYFKVLPQVSVGHSGLDLTPEKPMLDEWLNCNPLKRGAKINEVKEWINGALVSIQSKTYLKKHLHEVLHNNVLKFCLPPKGLFRRLDFYNTLMNLKDAKLLVIYGRRRQGKTCALPLELLHARLALSGIRDEVIFYHAGVDQLPEGKILTILFLLSHMHIPVCWDEFTSLEANLSLAFKATLEDNRFSWDPLSNLLFGSNEKDVREKGLNVSMMTSRGGRDAQLQEPSLEIIAGIFNTLVLENKNEEVATLETASKFLRRFSMYGYNLYEHIERNSPEESLRSQNLSEITFLSERRVRALQNLIKQKGKSQGIDQTDLQSLEGDGFIKKKLTGSGGGQDYEFIDPQLIAYQWRGLQDDDKVDGFVFEMMVRSERNLLPGICRKIATAISSDKETVMEAASKMLHGDFGKECEIDGLFAVDEKLIMLSCKRSWRKGDWEGFDKHLKSLWESKHIAKKLLHNAKNIICVGLSALPVAESCRENCTLKLKEHPCTDIPMTHMLIVMWDIIQSFRPLEFASYPDQKL